MEDAPDTSYFSDESFSSGYSSDSEPTSPPIIIRRPVAPAPTPTTPSDVNSSPYPRDASPFQVVTPVIITPVDVRSPRNLVGDNRLRRARRHQHSRHVLNSIRRRLSIVSTRTETPMNTPNTLPRSQRIDKTSTAIELESSDAFQNLLSEALAHLEIKPRSSIESIPSSSSKRAKMREFNRLEALNLAHLTLNSDSEDEILEAIGLLEWSLSQLSSEADTINRMIDDFEKEKQRKMRKWTQLELILTLIREEDQ